MGTQTYTNVSVAGARYTQVTTCRGSITTSVRGVEQKTRAAKKTMFDWKDVENIEEKIRKNIQD